jgi:hypothetical protein
MPPTVFIEGSLRFYFFSREEARMHVHVQSPDGEAKFWLEPAIELALNKGLGAKALKKAEALVKSHEQEIRSAWRTHFPG